MVHTAYRVLCEDPRMSPELSVVICTRDRPVLLRRALEANGWNVVETAKRLDVARSQVYKLINVHRLARTRK